MNGFGKIVAREQRIRIDPAGSGLWHAPRGARLHKGLDIEVFPNEEIFSPIAGTFVRVAKPYADDARYGGIIIAGKWCTVRMFYLSVLSFTSGEFIRKGDNLGFAQDVSLRYPGTKMKPHVHIEIDEIDPTIFMEIAGPRVDTFNVLS